jgi:ABC-2 type transport system ATP-binding protein
LLRITVRDDSTYDLIRDAAAELGAPIARMQLTRHKLEELFRDQSVAGAHG